MFDPMAQYQRAVVTQAEHTELRHGHKRSFGPSGWIVLAVVGLAALGLAWLATAGPEERSCDVVGRTTTVAAADDPDVAAQELADEALGGQATLDRAIEEATDVRRSVFHRGDQEVEVGLVRLPDGRWSASTRCP